MKKKIIFMAIFAVLLMIFTSIGYGGEGKRWKLLERPNQEDLSPSKWKKIDNLLLITILPWNDFCLVGYIKTNLIEENSLFQNPIEQPSKSKANESNTVRKAR